jgi:hypothetical protein
MDSMDCRALRARNDTVIMKKYLILTTFYLLLMGCAHDAPCDPARDRCALTTRGGEIVWSHIME